jgi:hypothetical protein
MQVGDPQWYAMVLGTIGVIVREEYPITRKDGPDPELIGNLLHHAREHGADGDVLRSVLRASPEYAANQAPPEPEPAPEPEPTATDLALPVEATPRGWKDRTGVRPMLFASWFPMLRILRDDPDRFERTLDMLKSWGVQGVRAFVGVCHPAYWPGREVMPVRARRVGDAWPDFDALVGVAARALRERGMAWFVTAGDLQEFDSESEVYARAFRALRQADALDVVAVVDVNEAWQNTSVGEDDAKHCARLLKPFADAGVSWATSAHSGDDSREHIDAMWQGVRAPVATIHGPGGRTLMVRHIINHRHDSEGVGFRVALMQGEPRGPGQDVSAGAVNETSWVVLAAVAACMTGQLYVLHCSRGVRDRDNDDPWEVFEPYFRRASAVISKIPASRVLASVHGGRGGANDGALFASTRSDGAFHEDRPGIVGEFHRCDSVLYENGQRACLLYGGVGDRGAKVVRSVSGAFYNTHGHEVRSGAFSKGEIVRFTQDEAGDGLLFVGA